ncbi:DUF2854 domain-containing protein [Synechococcus sp. BSF8S]|uniref:DUF2854 domain-containing protein n=1 Tax=Synechococcales TaxID=1890424 RepID=UPI00162AD5B2|nr:MULTISPECIES: DUF2854 domain-containing protein [unclassified Synechococcus]MBC1260820.1 DUF2854 domain-containing protein [Synechococcus sp. BSF8S]MBC1263496.1 DUF2854 domain-containing protein [Synechococcus sp. BSA11S]MCT0247845.1 DUF2854 domain-containing protein [Synechococcus sp. CS-205]
MEALTSPGSLLTILGAALTVIGSIAYATDSPNISLAGVFYGVPVLLGGLALKSSELPPATRLTPASELRELRERPESEPLRKLLKDVTRWRYGQKAHLESSLEALKLWNDDQPPELVSVAEQDCDGGYGLVLHFRCHGVPPERWQAKQERLGRFFGPGLRAELRAISESDLELSLLPATDVAEPTPTPTVS